MYCLVWDKATHMHICIWVRTRRTAVGRRPERRRRRWTEIAKQCRSCLNMLQITNQNVYHPSNSTTRVFFFSFLFLVYDEWTEKREMLIWSNQPIQCNNNDVQYCNVNIYMPHDFSRSLSFWKNLFFLFACQILCGFICSTKWPQISSRLILSRLLEMSRRFHHARSGWASCRLLGTKLWSGQV